MYTLRIDRPTKKIRLDAISTKPPKGFRREDGDVQLAELQVELHDLQELMFGAKTHSLLAILQGRDAAGKDGTVRVVMGAFNPRGVEVASFSVPSEEERSHDFLWRIHRHAPALGNVAIFNRSHYEDVLVVRVNQLAPEEHWRKRYGYIDAYEENLADANTIIVKFFLNISPEEQIERFLDREREPVKAWKVNVRDWEDREHWGAYTEAYEEVLRRCASPHAPWHVVPSDAKWFRNLAVAEALCAALRPHRETWQAVLDERSREARKEMARYRRARGRAGRKRNGAPGAPR
jgi:PPK2 family polyphosphate:nucleotide phosphotransferase